MSSQIFVDFRPAELRDTSSGTLVVFYVKNPNTGILERQRIKINHIRAKKERLKYGRLLVQQVNERLYEGWNPIVEKAGFSKVVSAAEAADLYRKSYIKGIRPDSLRCYDSQLKAFMVFATNTGNDTKPVCQIGKREAQQFMLHIEERGIGAKTYNNYIRFMGQFFNFCVDKGLVKDNPFASIKLKRVDVKKRTVIPPEDRKRIMEYFIENKMDGFRIICLLVYHCLIRPKELLMLKVSDVNLKDGIIDIHASVAKNHCERLIALPNGLISAIAAHVKGALSGDYIFSLGYQPGRKLLSSRNTGRTWAIMRKAIGLPDSYQLYSLKDTGITEMLEAGVPDKMVQELADHHSLEMTQKYIGKSKAEDIKNRCDVITF